MKQIPILFSSAMVRAILEGRKLQTRRVVKPQPERAPAQDGFMKITEFLAEIKRQDKAGRKQIHTKGNGKGLMFPNYPYKPGDVLWVRESFAYTQFTFDKSLITGRGEVGVPDSVIYSADDPKHEWDGRYKPSIHMPKEAARIWLEVVSVRVERLQDISEDDAKAEGTTPRKIELAAALFQTTSALRCYRDGFNDLWCDINGKESWDANPWVWVVEFKVLSTTGKPEDIE